MRFRIASIAGGLAVIAALAHAHDLFIKLDTYYLDPGQAVEVHVLNGTFGVSENAITRDRVVDISLVSPSGRTRLDTTRWMPGDKATRLRFTTVGAGTYVVGASTAPREIDLTGADFNEYLEHDGILDVLEARRRSGDLEKPAREQYAKHVKAIFQVGERRSDEYGTVLGYPAELIPLDNPYTLSVGSEMRLRCLVNGEPVADQQVLFGNERMNGVISVQSERSDANGVVRVEFDASGKWYVKFINMVRVEQPGLDYVSEWASVTFEVQ
jgi:uncharacterized GH25 family protein